MPPVEGNDGDNDHEDKETDHNDETNGYITRLFEQKTMNRLHSNYFQNNFPINHQ